MPIPVTIALLRRALAEKRWPVDYPPHSLPKYRLDLMANTLIFLLFAAMLLSVLEVGCLVWVAELSNDLRMGV